jgi:Zn-dependent M28 family amino/carboxypeptidase
LALLSVPGAKSTVLIGAHGDHLGHGENGNSLWRGERAIHYGADDNASGVAGVMEIARSLSEKVRTGQLKLKQNILFGVWTGEEIGILGSTKFASSPLMKQLGVSAYLNMDMIGRYRDQLLIQGTASATEWRGLVEQAAHGSPLSIHVQDDPYLPSDALTFYMKEIPIVFFFTGSHAEYHTPKDRPETINYDGLAEVARVVESLAARLAQSPKSLVTYRKVESTSTPGGGRGLRLYLGTVPDYTQEGKNGVVISGTSKDSPAEKAGLRAGDTIIEMGGMKIKNIYDYVYCLQALKANAKTSMRILRDGREQELEITPLLKQ